MNNILPNALILPEISPLSYEFGGMTDLIDKIIFPDGSILNNLPVFEAQSHIYFDDWGCVSHSLETGCQVLIIKEIDSYKQENQEWIKDNIYKNGIPDFSDRDLIVLSGTTPGIGNSGEKVLLTAQKKGLIPQVLEEWDSTSRNPDMTEVNFYAYARTKEAQKKADEWNARFEITG
jgi:hypothetical protein